jgi:argininosuccinate lyase
MVGMSRISEELVLWSSTEFGFIELSDQYASTSSIMPQKKNPDTAELVRGKSGIAVGSLMSLLTVCKSLPMSYNRDMQDASPHIWKSVENTRASVRIMAGMLDSMKVDKNTMKWQASTGFTTATELADTLVRECGIPFRTAHQIVGILAKGDVEPTLEDVEAVGRTVLGESLTEKGLNEDMVKQALDPMLNIQKRKVTGGPAPEAMKASIDNFGIKTRMWIEEVERIKDHTTDSIEKLMQIVEDYIQQK